MLANEISIRDCGDSGLRLTASYNDRDRNWRIVHRLARWLRQYDAPGLRGVVPTYDSLLIEFDPMATDHQNLRYLLSLRLETADAGALPETVPGRLFHVPVVFGGDPGPDLAAVGDNLGLTVTDLTRIVCGSALTIRCLAQAGAPMVDGPNFAAPVPRRNDPRTSVPAGSVAVAGIQGIVIPTPAPCGWQLLGRTPVKLVDPQRSPLLSYQPGDSLKFFAIDESDWDDYANAALGEIDVR